MKLLIDENLPPRVAGLLVEAGHDAAHVRDLDATGPSVILVREVVDRRPTDLTAALVGCIEQLEAPLTAGAMVALTPTGARVRRLPLL